MAIRAGALADVKDLTPGIGIGIPAYVFKVGGNETLASNVTLQDDNDLLFALVANAKYEVEFVLSASGDTGDLKTAWTVPAGAVGTKFCIGPTQTVGTFVGRGDTNAQFTVRGASSSPSYQLDTAANGGVAIIERGYVTTAGTAGNLVLQWAQATSSATVTTVEGISYLKITRIS